MMKVCLVLVTYNRYHILLDTIEAIYKQSRLPDYFIIVDNYSSDGTYQHLLTDARFVTIQASANEGYGAAASRGIQYARSKYIDIDYFWIMDDDSRPSEKTLQTILTSYGSLAVSKIGIIGLVGFKLKFGGYTPIASEADSTNVYMHKDFNLVESDFVLMDGSLITKEVVDECGIYVTDYFMIAEDYEYCKRVSRKGFKVALLLSADAKMERLALGAGVRFSRSSIWRGYYQARNHVHILRKYFSIKDLFGYSFRQAKFLGAALRAPDRFERIYYRLLGIFHGIKGRYGKTVDPNGF